MQAGTFKRQLLLQRPAKAQDGIGQPQKAGWTDVAPVWADIRYQSGLEAVKADSLASVARACVRIRYRTGLDASMRLVDGPTVYHVKAVLPDIAGKQYVDLICEVRT